MKKKSFIVSALSAVTLAGIMLGVACRKDNQVANRAAVAGTLAVDGCGCGVYAADSTIAAGAITVDLKLDSTKHYKLAGMVYITNNKTLTIPAGTKIYGAIGDTAVGGNPGGGLVITKGSKLIAKGTSSCPIVFTSADTVNHKSGDWAGIILLGKATTNQSTLTTVEGINSATAPAGVDVTFGGSDDADNSGILQWVRIEYAGHALSLNNEINALTMAGVGNGTTIDHVEAFKSYDDSFEWFGGTVNASHLVSIDALDDMFDTDNGFRGTIRYALGVSDPTRADQSQSNGFESDNQASGVNTTPITHPVYRYVTIIGPSDSLLSLKTGWGPGGSTGSYGRAAHLRRNAEFDIDSSIFQGFRWGLSLDEALPGGTPNTPNSYYKYFTTGASSTFRNLVHAYQVPYLWEKAGGVTSTWTPKAGDVDVNSVTLPLPNGQVRGSGISSYLPALTLRSYGAFPGGTDWTTEGTCSKWFKVQ